MEKTNTSTKPYTDLDRFIHGWQARYTMGLSPAAVILAYLDWYVHLATSPGKQAELTEKGQQNAEQLLAKAFQMHLPTDEALTEDSRFKDKDWQQWPFNLIYKSFLLNQQWWQDATTEIPGVARHHEDMLSFGFRQWLDFFSPSNYFWTNPNILNTTVQEGGANLLRGADNFIEDWNRLVFNQKPPENPDFVVGKTVGITPGKVVYRNRLIELIQYAPTTKKVQAEPILIVPAWIMKYYILDLSPNNSLVKYLVDQGHTVFMISWKNPGSEDRDLGMDDYRTLGVLASLDVISKIVKGRSIHAVGYCIGGTLLSIAASAMARDGDNRLASVTLFTTQTDFTEPGELGLFIDESQVAFLEDIMWNQGYLEVSRMAGAFQLLRSNDLIWSRVIEEYWQGKRETMTDLMAWNSDGTRLPYRMHSEYLRSLFLNNALFEGHFKVDGRPIVLSDIRVPIFAVATAKDHVAPWRSVYKLMLPVDTEVTFVLTSGGHNAGIVSEPGHPHRAYQIATRQPTDKYIDPDVWQAETLRQEGSWWLAWRSWLATYSSGLVAPPTMGAEEEGYPPLADAPGSYVLQT